MEGRETPTPISGSIKDLEDCGYFKESFARCHLPTTPISNCFLARPGRSLQDATIKSFRVHILTK